MLTVLWMTVGLMACGEKAFSDTAIVTGEQFNDTAESIEENDFQPDENLYYFENIADENTVAYSGQVFRHLLINDVKAYLDALETRLNTGVVSPGDVTTDLRFYFQDIKDIDVSMVQHQFYSGALGLLQPSYGDISSGKNLFEKIAGADTVTDHRDWQSEFVGWDEERITSPESLVMHWTDALDTQAATWTDLSTQVPYVYVSPSGLDYSQLLRTFLLGAVAFSQGTDDYLDDDVDGKGLLSSHIPTDGQVYSDLEHAWDEGFGYFGAAQDYALWRDVDLDVASYLDRNEDGMIDLKTEVSWGHSRDAGQRDLGSNMETDFTRQAWGAFWRGRRLLHDTVGTDLTTEQMAILQEHRDAAVTAWEMVLVANVIHHLNQTLQNIDNEAELGQLAKSWSQMKGMALSLQFNPHSPLQVESFVELHTLIGMRPDRTSNYMEALVQARELLVAVYEIDSVNIGGRNGENGW